MIFPNRTHWQAISQRHNSAPVRSVGENEWTNHSVCIVVRIYIIRSAAFQLPLEGPRGRLDRAGSLVCPPATSSGWSRWHTGGQNYFATPCRQNIVATACHVSQ